MRIISYNLRKNRALNELDQLALEHAPDIFCLQEADAASLPEEVAGLRLAHSTAGNRLGLAIYTAPERFEVADAQTYQLKSSMHDRVLAPAKERLLGLRLIDKLDGRGFVAASFHAAPLTALNSLRRHQIETAHSSLRELGEGLPSLMIGDFNYPVFQNKLDRAITDHGFLLSVGADRTYSRYKVFRGRFDFATSLGLKIDSIQTLARGASDHMPIMVDADYYEPVPLLVS